MAEVQAMATHKPTAELHRQLKLLMMRCEVWARGCGARVDDAGRLWHLSALVHVVGSFCRLPLSAGRR